MGWETSPYPYALIYPQDEHERLLIERLTELGTTVKRETEVLSFERTDDRVQLKIRKSAGTQETCALDYVGPSASGAVFPLRFCDKSSRRQLHEKPEAPELL
jgi:hypothetical protein